MTAYPRQMKEPEVDAYTWHQELRKKYPKYAYKARKILTRYLEKYAAWFLPTYLGEETRYYNAYYSRFAMFYIASDICHGLEEFDRYPDLSQEANDTYKIRLHAHIKSRLRLPPDLYEADNQKEQIIPEFNELWRV